VPEMREDKSAETDDLLMLEDSTPLEEI